MDDVELPSHSHNCNDHTRQLVLSEAENVSVAKAPGEIHFSETSVNRISDYSPIAISTEDVLEEKDVLEDNTYRERQNNAIFKTENFEVTVSLLK